jgi:hypothetical protein
LNRSLFSLELKSFFLATAAAASDSFSPKGLRLVSRDFFDLDSDLDEPLMAFVILCIERSIDSIRLNFGEADLEDKSVSALLNESMEEAEATPKEATTAFSSLKELDLLRLEATSLLNAPNSWARFLTTLDSGLGLRTEVITVAFSETAASDSYSGPSSGMVVGLGCFLMITLDRADDSMIMFKEDSDEEEEEEEDDDGEVYKALDGKGLTSVVGLELLVWVEIVNLDVVGPLQQGGLHSGEMVFLPASADRG